MKIDDTEIKAALARGDIRETDDGYEMTETGLQRLMYEYASHPDSIDLAARLAKEFGRVPPVYSLCYLLSEEVWFTLVDDALWSAKNPQQLVEKLIEHYTLEAEEDQSNARRYTH